MLLFGGQLQVYACDSQGRTEKLQSYDAAALGQGLDACSSWQGEKALVLGCGHCHQYSRAGIYADLPRPDLPAGHAWHEMTDRCYSYHREWLRDYRDVQLVLPLGEWLGHALQAAPGWCCLESDTLYMGGNGALLSLQLGEETQASVESLIAALPDNSRWYFVAHPPTGWLANYTWQAIEEEKIISAWETLAKN